jgi:hypothetical protein
VVSAYGDARQKAAAAAAKPMIALLAKQEMEGWNTAIADMLKQEKVQSAALLSPTARLTLKRDLWNRLHNVFMREKLGTNYVQSLPTSVDKLRQPKAKELVNQLNTATQAIMNFNQPAKDTAQQLIQWTDLSQAAYDAMSLTQFYPTQSSRAVSAEMPEILPNPTGSYNIGKLELTRDPVDQLIVQKIQAELKTNPKARLRPKANTDGSISIGSQRFDPRNSNEAKAIARIKSAAGGPAAAAAPPAAPAAPAAPAPTAPAAPQPAQNKPAAAPATFNAANIMKTIKPTAVAAESNRKQQLTQNNKK